jgi:hypothetical protein
MLADIKGVFSLLSTIAINAIKYSTTLSMSSAL